MPADLAALIAQGALPQQMSDGTLTPTLTVAQIEEWGKEDQLLRKKMLPVDMSTNTFDLLTLA